MSLKKLLVSATNDDDGHGNGATEEDDVVEAREKAVVDHVDGGVREEVDIRTLTLKSSLRKVDSKKEKKKVQWVDVMGIKELADIREFELSGEDDIDSDGEKNCLCVIL